MFAKPVFPSQWLALYIGQTVNFRECFANHPEWVAAARLGATHIHTRAVSLLTDRQALEEALVDFYQPALNIELRAGLQGDPRRPR